MQTCQVVSKYAFLTSFLFPAFWRWPGQPIKKGTCHPCRSQYRSVPTSHQNLPKYSRKAHWIVSLGQKVHWKGWSFIHPRRLQESWRASTRRGVCFFLSFHVVAINTCYPIRRTQFTEDDEDHLCLWIAQKIPYKETGGRTGNRLYQQLCEQVCSVFCPLSVLSTHDTIFRQIRNTAGFLDTHGSLGVNVTRRMPLD
jgi:hypothetical protein